MVDSEPVAADHKIAGSYHGTDVQPQYRSIEACQYYWNKEVAVGSFDDLVVQQLEFAKTQGRNVVVILDIGSGQGNVFREFLSDSSFGQRTRAFLSDNNSFSVEMIGITDAQSPEELLTEQAILADGPAAPDNSRIRASNVKYTLSYRQRIRDVLSYKHVEGIDLCISTVALPYLGPSAFEHALSDVIDHMHSGGRMIAYDYSGIAPGIVQPDAMFLSLDIRSIPEVKTEASIKLTLHERSMRAGRRGLNVEDEERALEQAEQLMVRLGVVPQSEIDKRVEEYKDDPDYPVKRMTALGRRATGLAMDEKNLISKHILKLRAIKKAQLGLLFETHKGDISGSFTEQTIYFSKR